MSVSNGQLANQTTFNNAFMSRTSNTSTIAKIDLLNADHSSVNDIQRELVAISRYTGKVLNTSANTPPDWADNSIGASSDSLFNRIEALQADFVSKISGQDPGGVLFGELKQDSGRLFYNDASGFLGIGHNAPSAALDINGGLAFVGTDVTLASSSIDGAENSFVRIAEVGTADDLETIPAPAGNANQVKLVANVSGEDIAIVDSDNIETAGATVVIPDNGLVLLL